MPASRAATGIAPEARLLIDLARGLDAAPEHGAAGLCAERFFELAQRHQVAGLVHHYLRERPDRAGNCLSPDLRFRLRAEHSHHALRNECLVRDLQHVADALARHRVEFLVFKGPWLAHCAYPTPGSRPMDDLDLGIRERDFAAGLEALGAAGYRLAGAAPADGSAAIRKAHYGAQLRFVARMRRPIELHFRMINIGPPADEGWVWRSAREVALAGARIAVPGPDAMLLHLVVHANQHGFSTLRHLHDIAFALRADSGRIDWDDWRRRVDAHGLAASTHYSLLLAQDLCGAEIPAQVLRSLRPGSVRRFVFERAWRVRRARELRSPPRSQQLEAPLLYLLEMGSVADKLRYAARLVEQAGGMRGAFRKARLACRGDSAPRARGEV